MLHALLAVLICGWRPASAWARTDMEPDLRAARIEAETARKQYEAESQEIELRRRSAAQQRQKEVSAAHVSQLWTYVDGKGETRFFPMHLQVMINQQNPLVELIEDDGGEVIAFRTPRGYGAYSLYDVNGEHVYHEQGQNGAAVADYTLENVVFGVWTPAAAAARGVQAAVRAGEAAGFASGLARRGFLINWRQFTISLGKKAHDVLFKLTAAQRSRTLHFTENALKSKGWAPKTMHAADFGILGPQNKANLEAFGRALQTHVRSAENVAIAGSYKGERVVHFLNPRTGLNVISKLDGQFVSGWRLNPGQLGNILSVGKL